MVNDRLFGLARRAWWTAKNGYSGVTRSATQLRWFIENEAITWEKAWLPMSPRRRLWLWRHGFLSRSGVLYDLDEHDYRRYLSDYQRLRTQWINGEQRIALDNKLLFDWMMEPFAEHRVATYGLLENGRFHDVRSLQPAVDGGEPATHARVTGNGRGTADATEWVTERLREEGALMAKPRRGGGGRNVMRWSFFDNAYRVNGEETPEAEFESLVGRLDGHLVTEVVEQADYATELFAESANTLRVLTMYDHETDEPYIPIVAHRIGTERSAPVDNFSSGGLAAEVDRETGELSEAVSYPYSGSLDWHETHPDTGARIEGREVTAWPTVREGILDMAATFSHTPYIGWDVIVTDEGEFTVIEANSCSDMDVLQVHRPLLTDPRVRRFYEHHGVVSTANG